VLFAVVANGELQLFDASRGDTPIYTEPFSGFARTLAFSPDGRHLAIGGQADQVRAQLASWQHTDLGETLLAVKPH
jgi:hypothetical protein